MNAILLCLIIPIIVALAVFLFLATGCCGEPKKPNPFSKGAGQ